MVGPLEVIALHCIALRCAALRCSALHCTALHCTALHCTALHCTALHCTALHCTALHCTALHCTALHCTALHCTDLPASMPSCLPFTLPHPFLLISPQLCHSPTALPLCLPVVLSPSPSLAPLRLLPTRWQQVRQQDGDLHLCAIDADEFVDDKEKDGAHGVVGEEGNLDESPRAVHHHEDEEDRPRVVSDPEGTEGVTARVLHGERVDDEHENREKYARQPCDRETTHENQLCRAQSVPLRIESHPRYSPEEVRLILHVVFITPATLAEPALFIHGACNLSWSLIYIPRVINTLDLSVVDQANEGVEAIAFTRYSETAHALFT